MKGVVLAGGLGTRLRPLTSSTNKHLLPVAGEPMINYSLRTLVEAGIEEILVVTGADQIAEFGRLLGDGGQFGIRRLELGGQKGQGGAADALRYAEAFVGDDMLCTILGDNIFGDSLKPAATRFAEQRGGARILLKEVQDPRGFGVARFEGGGSPGRLVGVVEKPESPTSRFAVTGAYFFDRGVFEICNGLRPGPRGETEIADVLNAYIARGKLEYEYFEGEWADAGTFEGMAEAAALAAARRDHRSPARVQAAPKRRWDRGFEDTPGTVPTRGAS